MKIHPSLMTIAALASCLLLSTATATSAKSVGKIGGSGGFTLKCTWACHPKIKKARAQYCFNKKGQKKLVYWESMSVRCGNTEEGG